jgi:hypothetical protein
MNKNPFDSVVLFVELYCSGEMLQGPKDYLSLTADLLNYQLL